MRCARICTATPRNGSTDDHELTRVLGKGGFGVVVKVRHRATGVDVALKCLTRSSDDGSGKRRRRAHVLHRDLPREACYLAATPSLSACRAVQPRPGWAAWSRPPEPWSRPAWSPPAIR
ncbi:hypothetical protein ZWY2020_001550 [Hordeum vulgare]|nr:hypothetical protein ZWY2020_001530 [Hordeum vulgare]KAI4970636.1 hypothetical protein ZWY2020_001550 [Hordeum vulgare]